MSGSYSLGLNGLLQLTEVCGVVVTANRFDRYNSLLRRLRFSSLDKNNSFQIEETHEDNPEYSI
jgi:hypothetical protein